jgi:hypothetical protein
MGGKACKNPQDDSISAWYGGNQPALVSMGNKPLVQCFIESLNICSQSDRMFSGNLGSLRKPNDPVVDKGRVGSKLCQALDIGASIARKHRAYRNQGVAQGITSAQDSMNQCSPSPAIAVDEGVDCLKLGVCDGGPHHGVPTGFGNDTGQVLNQGFHFRLWRGDELCPKR